MLALLLVSALVGLVGYYIGLFVGEHKKEQWLEKLLAMYSGIERGVANHNDLFTHNESHEAYVRRVLRRFYDLPKDN